jgi:hypothetical protein
LTTWIQGFCAQSPCSNASLAAIITNFTAGCPGIAAEIGLNSSTEAAVIKAVQEAFPIQREILCLKTYVMRFSFFLHFWEN